MSQPPDPQLREIIYNRMAESDECYLFVYSGEKEKLTLLSVLLKGLRNKTTRRLLIDLGAKQYVGNLNVKGTTLITNLSQITGKNSLKSCFLRFVHDEIEKLSGARGSVAHVLAAIDLSSLFVGGQASNEHDIYSIHKSMVYLAHSLKGVTAVLLYDADSLTESLMSKLADLHWDSDRPLKELKNPTNLKDISKLKANAPNPRLEIVSLGDRILLFDPPQSAALLLPNTDAIKDVLPSDPLNITHRDLAFGNNYTAHEGACPYFSSKAQSGCLLDPNVVRTTRVKGRSFIEGHPCITSTDHSVLESKPEKTKETNGNGDGDSKLRDNDKERQQDSQPEPISRARQRSKSLVMSAQGNREGKSSQESLGIAQVQWELG